MNNLAVRDEGMKRGCWRSLLSAYVTPLVAILVYDGVVDF
jgi:hypothetical protein